MVTQINPVIAYSMRALCQKSYLDHPKGCENYNKKEGCPPLAPFFDQHYDMKKPFYAIWTTFEIGEHAKRMKEAHPTWTDRQCRCCLYWQQGARANLRIEIEMFLQVHPHYEVTTCPEGMGINVSATMKNIGIELAWPPRIITYQIAIAGILKNSEPQWQQPTLF